MTAKGSLSTEEICCRYRRIFVAAVADILDGKGLWHQIMDSEIQGVVLGMKVAGPAFTIFGLPERSTDKSIRRGAKVVDYLRPYQVAVMFTGGDRETGHWGELLSNAAVARGATGAVIDGGLRDTSRVVEMGFPVFCKYRRGADATGRFNVLKWEVPIVCGGVLVHPGDFVFGDSDGVVVVPNELTVEVLLEAERVVATEDEIRQKVRRGDNVGDLYMEYERF